VLPVCSKIFETSINNRLCNYLSCNRIIDRNQFGFQKNSNTTVAIVNLFNTITTNLEAKKIICCLFIDLKKAFDFVNHKKLLSKVEEYGIVGDEKHLLFSYISNREEFVEIDGVRNFLLGVECGVQQGSILGPTLFLIYM
jgi:hypothetical protein